MSELTAKELNLITDHISKIMGGQMKVIKDHLDDRIKNSEDTFSSQVKGLQLVHETNYEALLNEIREVGRTSSRTEKQATITNGRMTKVEGLLHGDTDENKKGIKGREGILQDLAEIKKYRMLYKRPMTLFSMFLIMCFLFIKESREVILDWFGF